MNKTKSIILLILAFSLLSFSNYKPKLFVIGDSISIFYGPYLETFLDGKYEYDRKRDEGQSMKNLDNPAGANGGDSRMVVQYMEKLYASHTFSEDILLVNCGLHDIKTNPQTGKVQIDIDEYKHNLNKIYNLAKKLKTQLIWVNSTPVNDSIHNAKSHSFHRFNKDVLAYNSLADSVFKSKNIPVIDLYAFSAKFPLDAYIDHVHYTTVYRKLQAAYIAGFIQNYQTHYTK